MNDAVKTREELLVEMAALRARLADFEQREQQHEATEAALRTIQTELEKLNEELESRARARATDLEAANRDLRKEIAERKRAEQSLQESEMVLKKAQAAAQMGFYAWDMQDDLLFWSDQLKEILGCVNHEPSFDLMVSLLHPDDRERVLAAGDQFREKNVAFLHEYRIIRPDGVTRHVRDYAEITRDEAGKLLRMFGTTLDITELKQAESHHLNFTLEKERSAMLRTLIANIAHDVKTPLAAITMSLYLLEKHTDPAKRQQKIDNITNQVHILENFIQDLLAISRLDSEPELQLTWIDVNMVLSSIQENLRPVIERRQIQINLELAHPLPQIEADYADIRRALVNLIENAITYTPESGAVSIKTRPEDDSHIGIEIADTGIGISADDLPHIFDRFYRAQEAQSMTEGGSGIGLAIVKRVIDLHNGEITVDSTVGKGSVFTIKLPIVQDPSAE